MTELSGKTAVVCGGALGIGRATALELAARGAAVAIADRDAAAGGRTLADLRAGGAAAEFHHADLACWPDVERAASAILARFGGVDILVNTAGIQRYGDALDTSEHTWREVMDANVKSMFLSAKAFLPSLTARTGSIINVASVQGFAAMKSSVAYVTSKHAVLGLTRALAFDHAPRVRVNCVAPASVDTPMLRANAEACGDGRSVDEMLAEWGKLHLMGRVAQPEEIARVIAFLASPDASFITGAVHLVDGGMLAAIK